ncbi:fimbrial isopeptide formation D2 domain-containing protein [Enterococcus faecium]|uniref:Fimbrial isopeptide formation D2 domain-containing protein n=5 Tax=Bacteria TaxID=2 RepID=A0A132P109_ENTFC|nr:fimbrial isopeptide formation D2 domain-containing protein [Enterococcus faecium]KWW58744.1 fimbrial isopeptide formation D2 domain-containing protein [Enterococcus faecium]KWW63978.1 fimbrial isopeptide formation D2 domain-containing protein [Enterococcus faecium]KWW64449.1 fimbrial isopeptide formation D2 domain-containing protein [Enterococcus faecium]KWW66639.1 fimbrial isopeptide formation D2 domain-containing protein [Enterococcus faecium]
MEGIMENKIHCTTGRVITLVLFLFLLLFARGTAVQALEKVDPSQIKENNNLVLYHDSDSLRNIEVTGINGFKILDEYSTKKQKVLAWPKVKDLKSTSKIVAHYQKVGTYLGKEIDCDVTFSNFVAHAGVNQDGLAKTINGKKYYNYLLFDKNIYRGFFMQSINVMNAKLEFKYAGTKTKVALSEPQPEIQSKMRSMRAAGIDLNDTFLSIYSLNGQYQQRVSWYNDNNESVGERNIDMREFVGYEKMGSLPYFVTTDTACAEYKAPALSTNNLTSKVVGGRAEKAYSSNDHFTDVVGADTYHRSGVTYTLQGASPTFMIGANTNSMMFSFDTALLWTPQPSKPTKEVFNKANTEEAAHNIDKKVIPQGSDVYYHIHQKFDALTVNTMNKYKSFKITDTFDNKNFDMVSDGKNYDGALWYVEANGTWKKADTGGKLTVSSNTVTYTASDSFLANAANYGRDYILQLHMKAKNDAKGIAPNVATVTFNNDPNKGTQKTNTVENYFSLKPNKKVEQDGKDVNGRNKGDNGPATEPLNAGSEVQYLVTQKWHTKGVDIALDHYKQFSIQDPIEDRMTYKEGSAQVIDQSTGKDITSEGVLTYDSSTKTLKWEASDDFLNNNLLDGREVQLIFTARTPLNKQVDIDNQANVSVENIEKETNVVTIGVNPNLPQVIVPKTGSNHLVLTVIGSILFLTLASLGYVVLKLK